MTRSPFVLIFVEDALARWRDHRTRVRTRRAVASLPDHLRKDIGWPDSRPVGRIRRGLWV